MSRKFSVVFSLLVGGLLALPATAGAASPISVTAIVGDPCVFGTAAPNKRVEATLRTPDGRVRGRFAGKTEEFGFFGGCFLALTGINGNDRLKIVVGSQSRTIVVPNLVPRTDRVTDTIEGKAAPHEEVFVSVYHTPTLGRSDFEQFDYTVMSNGSGRWSLDVSSDVDLLGGDQVFAIVQRDLDGFGGIGSVPQLVVNHAANAVTGSVNNGTRLQIELSDSGGNPKASVETGPLSFGRFQIELYDQDGDAVYPVPGDWFTTNLADDATLQMPQTNMHTSAADDTFSGRCMPNSQYTLDIRFRSFRGVTDGSGRISRDLSSRMNIRRGDIAILSCRYATGDLWIRANGAT